MSSAVSLRCTLNREYLPPNKKSVVYLALDILPPQSPPGARGLPSAICLLIDRSGSMKGERLDQAKAAAHQMLGQLQPTDYIGMMTFSSKIDRVADLEQVQSVDMRQLAKKIERLKAGGGTELYRGLEAAYEQLIRIGNTAGHLVKRVILLSDGKPDDDIPDTEYKNLAARMREMGISVQTLGVGPDYNEDLLGSIAEYSGGMWQHISSPSEIITTFVRQLTEARTIVATMPEILMRLSQDVQLQQVYKAMPDVYPVTNLKLGGAYIRIPLSDIRAGEAQTLAAKLSLPPRPEGQCRLATVEIAGEPGSQADVIATYTADERLLGMESNAFPRGVFLTAETQVLTRVGLMGNKTALRQAEQGRDTMLRDRNLTKIRAIHETAIRINETITKAKAGLTDEETKVAKQGMTETQIRRR